ncbi:hypothetical protein OAQ85_03650 [Schleiferiaceae bacterium]|nr:hypothetical protein [Schleiferiaceae bacterium]
MQHMNPESRLWFYGLDSPMSVLQTKELSALMSEFVNEWKAHGSELAAAFRLFSNQFLIITVDENQQTATGCSIDKSVHLLQEFGMKHNLDFFNRLLVHIEHGDAHDTYSISQLKEAIANGEVHPLSNILNTTATTLRESGTGKIALKDSWAAKYL